MVLLYTLVLILLTFSVQNSVHCRKCMQTRCQKDAGHKMHKSLVGLQLSTHYIGLSLKIGSTFFDEKKF